MQDPGNLLAGVPAAVHGHILELRFGVQLLHEDLLHFLLGNHHLRHEVQEALLLGK